jgi:hypothetical protein
MSQASSVQLGGEWKTVLARDLKEIESVRSTWEQLQSDERHPTPNANIDRFLSVVEAHEDKLRPYAMVVEHFGRPVAMIIGRIEKHKIGIKLGYKTLYCPWSRCLRIVYGGVLGQPDAQLSSLLVDELMKQLRQRQFDIVYFNYLRTNTPFYQAVQKTPGFLTKDHFPRIVEHWCMSVPDTIDQFYSARSRGHRHNLRRAIRKFDEECPGESKVVNYTTESDVDDFVRIAADLSSKTYQSALGVGIADNGHTKCRIRSAAARGRFRGHILFAGEKACAFQLALHYQKIYYMVNIGYDPALSSYKPGLILFLKVLESLCNDPSTNTIDFYFGDAEYKHRYGTEHWPEACIHIFGPRLCPVFINALRSSVSGTNAGLQHLANKIGFANWIKRRWRTALSTARVNL